MRLSQDCFTLYVCFQVDKIKEMARQLAALPKKQFEMYRTKKILSSDHSFLRPGSNQVVKDKLSTSFVSKTFISNVEKDLNVIPNIVDTPISGSDKVDNNEKPKTNNKKKRKSKKGKAASSVVNGEEPLAANFDANSTGKPLTSAVTSETGKPGSSDVDMKFKVSSSRNCGPLCISMNTNLVADISTGQEFESGQHFSSNRTDVASCGSCSSNDSGIVTPKELFVSDDGKEVDSGLGSYTSPVFSKEPPFGFPPSSQKLLESALGLLPNVALEKDDPSIAAENSENIKNVFQQSHNLGKAGHIDKTSLKNRGSIYTTAIDDDPVSDVSDTKEVCKDFVVIEGDSVDGDVSSSSAVEDEGGWQSQTRRSHRRKKKELAARTGKETRNHMERFQGKDFHKRQPENQFRKNHHRKKSVDDKKNHSKVSDKMLQNTENKNNNVIVESSPECAKSHLHENIPKGNESRVTNGLNEPSSDKTSSQKENVTTQRVLSYRDALLKAKRKVEGPESSDSGVDANSVSSCDLSIVQPAMQTNAFNQQQCVEYLRNAWKKVMSNAKQGLVVYFSVDTDPVLCEQKRKTLASSNHPDNSSKIYKAK
ncbi:unnamed protein product [Porites evermanni]|uniref:Uncharacterized protein n=1 Tax=Porites evermanni TaxID=104178 RepID=A0ABN8LC62_9CNID|nr:unnamed protein product [Porites evermanni]